MVKLTKNIPLKLHASHFFEIVGRKNSIFSGILPLLIVLISASVSLKDSLAQYPEPFPEGMPEIIREHIMNQVEGANSLPPATWSGEFGFFEDAGDRDLGGDFFDGFTSTGALEPVKGGIRYVNRTAGFQEVAREIGLNFYLWGEDYTIASLACGFRSNDLFEPFLDVTLADINIVQWIMDNLDNSSSDDPGSKGTLRRLNWKYDLWKFWETKELFSVSTTVGVLFGIPIYAKGNPSGKFAIKFGHGGKKYENFVSSEQYSFGRKVGYGVAPGLGLSISVFIGPDPQGKILAVGAKGSCNIIEAEFAYNMEAIPAFDYDGNIEGSAPTQDGNLRAALDLNLSFVKASLSLFATVLENEFTLLQYNILSTYKELPLWQTELAQSANYWHARWFNSSGWYSRYNPLFEDDAGYSNFIPGSLWEVDKVIYMFDAPWKIPLNSTEGDWPPESGDGHDDANVG